MTVKVRFAPSPTGRLHVGNIRTGLINWLFAKGQGGRFVLRIDDTDLERSTKEFEQAIETDLTWLGMLWDERHNQSARFPVYQEAVERLKAAGRLYPAYERPEELDLRRKVQLSRGQPPIYDRAALKLTDDERKALEAEGRRPHWRFRLEGKRVKWNDLARGDCEVDTASMSDPVLIREDGAFLYTLPSVVDDIDMGITHVIRGEDHVTNTGAQIEIFEALGAKSPAFAHTTLLVGADGQGLSKRLGSLSILELREQGYEPLAVISHLARIGTSDPLEPGASIEGLAGDFAFGKMAHRAARWDPEDLGKVNAAILHAMPYETAQPRLANISADLGESFWNAIRVNLTLFGDVAQWASVISGAVAPVIADEDRAVIDAALELLPAELDGATWSAWTGAIKERTGAKGRGLFMPLRKALTGLEHGPDMSAILPLIGRDKAARRLAGQTA
ncbi:MAG: glutamate--tRNA ligase [Caulobacter sp.]|jgi:glutamyl-tRNA synthetase|nr:glutamate--tRNA ligase [Caulobacter sp.]